jgi:hypothetical protein
VRLTKVVALLGWGLLPVPLFSDGQFLEGTADVGLERRGSGRGRRPPGLATRSHRCGHLDRRRQGRTVETMLVIVV